MKIGIVCSPSWGGSGVVATETGLELGSRGHEVHFISSERPVRYVDYVPGVFFHEVSHDPYPFFHHHPYALALASTMAEVIEEHKLDIIHAHYAMPHAVSAILARQIHPEHSFKLVTTLHGTDITLVGRSRSYFPLTKLALDQSDGVTAVSPWLRDQTIEFFGVDRSIDVIPNSIDLKRFHPDASETCLHLKSTLPKERKVLTHISNFRPVKRVLDVVEVFARVAQEREVHLLLVGDGPDRGAAHKRVADLGLLDRVTFEGTRQSVEVILAMSDIFLLPSEHESFGLAALEALACGCPVVASAGSGVETFIQSGSQGELATAGDVESMVAGALRILDNPEPYRTSGIETAQGYSLDQGAKMYEIYYQSIIDADKKTPSPEVTG